MTKLGLISDIHYYSPLLGTQGKAYRFREATDQKCLKESPHAFGSVCDILKNSDISAVVIPGDITNNGEKPCHEEAIGILNGLAEHKPTFVITSTHDWTSNGKAKKYEGDRVLDFDGATDRDTLPRLYEHFGKQQLVSNFTTSIGQISKSFEIGEVLIIAVNDDCDGQGGKSGYSAEHLGWVKSQINYARDKNLSPILFQHHLLIYNISPLINKGQSIADGYAIADELADAGLRLAVTGHSHFQRISQHTSKKGNTITQLNLGAICGFPGLITYLTVEEGKAQIKLEPYEFEYGGRTVGADCLKDKTLQLITTVIHSAATDTKEFAGILSANGIPSAWVKPLSPVIKSVFGGIEKITVGKAAKKINRLMLKKAIPENLYTGIADRKLLPLAKETFLCLFFDEYAQNLDGEFREVVRAASKLPRIFVNRLPLTSEKKNSIKQVCDEIERLAENLITPSFLHESSIEL